MNKFILSIFAMSLVGAAARADAPAQPDLRDKIAASCADYFKNIESLGYSVKQMGKRSLNYYKRTGEPRPKTEDENASIHWKYVSFQKKFRVDVAYYDAAGFIKEKSSVAFDGETLQNLWSGGRLDLLKKIPPDLGELTILVGMKSMFFAPFWFAQPNALSSLYHVDHPPAYHDRQLFSNFMTTAIPLGPDPNDPKSLRFQAPYHFNKSVVPTWNIPDHYSLTVTFDPETGYWYPTAWEIASAERGVLVRYEVQKVAVVQSGDGAEYPYPQAAVLKDFGPGLKKKSSYPDPLWQTSYTVENLMVNPKESPELQCMIDPAEAREIFYEDKDVFIPVPR